MLSRPRARLIAVLAAGLLTAGASLAPAGAEPTLERSAPTIQLTGNGFGHGHGLSQYGAQGAASQGKSYRQILAFYYPGLERGTAGGTVSVLLTADTSSDVVVSGRPGLKVKSLGSGRSYELTATGVRRWRIVSADGGRRSAIAARGAEGGWRTVRTVPGPAQFSAGGKPITLHTPAGRRAYRGVLRSAAPASTPQARDTVNIVALDSYLKGVVPREVPASWKPAAVRSQAVAARTYAAYERTEPLASHYQICDTSSCQVYGGHTDEVAASNQAVEATAGQILTTGGKPAFTQFSASNGGWMSAGSVPYLVAKEDPYDRAYQGWKDTVTAAEVERAFPALGAFRSATVTKRDGNGQWGGRVVSIRLVGSATATTISGDTFRSYFGLYSNWFTLG